MDSVDLIIKSSTEFYNDLKIDENGRYRSWEHCYSHFIKARGSKEIDYDYLSLQLAFYLASWGMYRGSSFLLQKDYKVHIPVVKELLSNEYDALAGIECIEFRKESNQQLLLEINSFLGQYYDKIRREVKGQELKNQLSFTLITKILMGTLGCVPAYDRYFIAGIKKQKVTTGNYNLKSIMKLVDFYEKILYDLNQLEKKWKLTVCHTLRWKCLIWDFGRLDLNWIKCFQKKIKWKKLW